MNSDIYIIELKKINSYLSISVNEIPVFSHSGTRVLEINIFINQYLINGSNTVKIVLEPSANKTVISEDSLCEFKVKNKQSGLVIAEYKTPDFTNKNEITFTKELNFYISIIKNPYFTIAPEIDKGFEQRILVFYQNVWNLLKQKAIDDYFELSKIKDLELAEAYNLTYNERIEDIRPVFERVLADSKMKLQPLDFSKLKINYYHYNKIVSLEDANLNPAIYFEEDSEDAVSRFKIPMYLCLNEKNELIIIR